MLKFVSVLTDRQMYPTKYYLNATLSIITAFDHFGCALLNVRKTWERGSPRKRIKHILRTVNHAKFHSALEMARTLYIIYDSIVHAG